MMEEIGDLPFCADFANPTDNLVNCTVVDDCCAVMKEFREILNEATNETSLEIVARHGCESDLDHFPNHEHRPFCSEYNNQCYEYEDSMLPNATDTGTFTGIETCFCDTDRCNNCICEKCPCKAAHEVYLPVFVLVLSILATKNI